MYTSLLSTLILFLVWLILLFVSRETRKEQLIMSMVGLTLSPILLFLAQIQELRMWGNVLHGIQLEDFLFSASVFGMAAVLYQFYFGKHLHMFKSPKKQKKLSPAHWLVRLDLIIGTWICLTISGILLLQFTPLSAFIVAGLMIGIYVVASREDLLIDALLSGFMTCMVVFLVDYLFSARLSGDLLFFTWPIEWNTYPSFGGIPAQKLLWAGMVGFTVGPLYEWLRSYSLK